MTRQRRALAGAGSVVLAVAAVLALNAVVSPQAVEIGVTVYENAGQGGDHMLTTGIPPNGPRRANLGLVTTGLSGNPPACNRGVNQSATWNDCISSASVSSLPANTKLQFWRDINYAGGLLACYDVDGSHSIDLSGTGDLISSFRVIGGNC